MIARSHYPKKKSLRKGFRSLLPGPLQKRVKQKEKGKSRPQASVSSASASAAKPSASSQVQGLKALASETYLLPEAPNPLLESNIESPVVQKQIFIATNNSNIDESNITSVDPQGQAQTRTLYPLEYNTLVTSALYSGSYSLPISGQDIQYTAPSFTSSITQASDLDFDINDSFPLQESSQTQFGAPSIQSPLVSDYSQDFGVPSGPSWPSNMGQDVQQGLPPSAPHVPPSSSSAGQELSLVKFTFDGGYSTYQVVEFDCRWDFNFIAQSSVEILQRSYPMQVMSVPPGIGRKTQCPNGGLINIERILYAGIEFESHCLPFPPVRVYFVVYDDFGGEDGVHMTLGRDWVNKIEQACLQIGYQGQL
ncbi:uncharacterized protein LW93_928 [Fusarium fujikuroi]|nr:uncharacterized protein LW93_928 [Fusarium fujikuroi]SCV35385.1 uncharacterized protein FFB14_05509 [Fusarium fujikuroi]